MTKRSPRHYEEMSRAVESGEYTVRGPIERGTTLRMGRPTKDAPQAGKTPVLAIRLPERLRTEVDGRVKAGESDSVSELVRRALVEYFDNHPARP